MFLTSLETSSHVNNLKGLRAILQVLMANIELPARTVRSSFMDFMEAISLFMPYHPYTLQKQSLTTGTEEGVHGFSLPCTTWYSCVHC